MNYYYPYQNYQTYNQLSQARVWVANVAEANNYPVAPNNSVDLWSSSEPVIYVKSADASGKAAVKIIDYKERQEETPETELEKELRGIRAEIKAIKEQLHDTKSDVTDVAANQGQPNADAHAARLTATVRDK